MVDRRRVGREEHRLAWHLVRQKLKVVQQAPCGPYRIDVGIWPVAVEVHCSRTSPERSAQLMSRAQYLIEHGWSVFYLWLAGHERFSAGRWGAPPEIAFYREQVLAGEARPYRRSRSGGTPKIEGEMVNGRLVVGLAPEPLPGGFTSPHAHSIWAALTDEERASWNRRETQLCPTGGLEPYQKRAIVVGRGYYRRKIWV